MNEESPYDDMINELKERIGNKNSKRLELKDVIKEQENNLKTHGSSYVFVTNLLKRDNVDDEIYNTVCDSMEKFIQGCKEVIANKRSKKGQIIFQKEKLEKQSEVLKEMRNTFHKDHDNLAIQKGVCSFPNSCNRRNSCTKDGCHYDECSNGHAFRRS